MPDDTTEFRASVRQTLAQVVAPHAREWERSGRIAEEAWRRLGTAGLLGLPHVGEGFRHSAVLLDELGATGYAGVRAAIGVHAYMAASYLHLFGTDEQRSQRLIPGARGTRIAALAISEDEAGTDLRRLSTRATPDGAGGHRLTGHKSLVANGSLADHFIVLARTGDAGTGLASASIFLVDGAAAGITRTPRRLTGWWSADLCRIEFDDVALPPGALIGRSGRALPQLMRALDFERLVAGLLATGGVRHCLDLMQRFVRSHLVRDEPLSANQAVRHRVAGLQARFDLLEAHADRAVDQQVRGVLDTRTASVLKLSATELAVSAARTCLQFHGARGYLEDSEAARIYRDAAAGTIAAGASELLLDHVFESSRPAR